MNTEKEAARLYAESKMQIGWDRNDSIEISIFYNHVVNYLLGRI